MGGELLSEADSPPKPFSEQFHEVFPQYLNMGMTYELFWLEDVTLVKAYRKAYQLSRERANFDAWLQGAYFYDAICLASPLLHAFAKSGTKPLPYLKEPYKLEGKTKSKEEIRAEFLAKWKESKARWKKKLQ